jgi:lipid II:glycine glycyltransferase (peptidoglycan interpeptide bridge formation enzyme)
MEARLISDRRFWNEFIADTPTGHLNQTYEWAEHTGEDARAGALRVGVLDHGRLVAAVALAHCHTSGVRAPFFYAPRGPVCADPTSPALAELIAFARREARQRGAFMIRVEPNVAADEAAWSQALRTLGFRETSHVISPRGAWITDLRADDDELLARMLPTWRNRIRTAARRGVTIRRGAGERDFTTFYRLLTETAARDQFYLYPEHVYRAMLVNYAPERAAHEGTAEVALFLAEYQGLPIAAATIGVFGTCAWYLHGASSGQPEHRRLDPSRLLLWHAMRWAKAHGAVWFDWKTIPDVLEPGEELYGVYAFKRGFGGFPRHVLPTHDLILRPSLYWPYLAVASLRRELHARRRRAFEARRLQKPERPTQREDERRPGRVPAPAPA